MNTLSLLGAELFGVYASVQTPLFKIIANGAGFLTNFIKWVALLYVVVKITMLGFKIATQAKQSSEAIQLVKEQGAALAIGLFIVGGSFMIDGALKHTFNILNTGGDVHVGTSTDGSKDGFSW